MKRKDKQIAKILKNKYWNIKNLKHDPIEDLEFFQMMGKSSKNVTKTILLEEIVGNIANDIKRQERKACFYSIARQTALTATIGLTLHFFGQSDLLYILLAFSNAASAISASSHYLNSKHAKNVEEFATYENLNELIDKGESISGRNMSYLNEYLQIVNDVNINEDLIFIEPEKYDIDQVEKEVKKAAEEIIAIEVFERL